MFLDCILAALICLLMMYILYIDVMYDDFIFISFVNLFQAIICDTDIGYRHNTMSVIL